MNESILAHFWLCLLLLIVASGSGCDNESEKNSRDLDTGKEAADVVGHDSGENFAKKLEDDLGIVNGKDVVTGEWFPWMVSVFGLVFDSDSGTRQWKHLCGGALIGPDWVITAGQCVFSQVDDPQGARLLGGDRIRIVSGTTDLSLSEKGKQHGVESVYLHPGFSATDSFYYKKDLALLKLTDPYQGPILGFGESILENLEWSVILGWGMIGSQEQYYLQNTEVNANLVTESEPSYSPPSASGGTDQLKYTMAKLISPNVCSDHLLKSLQKDQQNHATDSEVYKEISKLMGLKLTAENICTTPSARTDVCKGDIGGPLLTYDHDRKRFLLAGVISSGIGCALEGFPSIHTRTTGIKPWVDGVLAGQTQPDPPGLVLPFVRLTQDAVPTATLNQTPVVQASQSDSPSNIIGNGNQPDSPVNNTGNNQADTGSFVLPDMSQLGDSILATPQTTPNNYLENSNFTGGRTGWVSEVHRYAGASADVEFIAEKGTAKVTGIELTGIDWHLQFTQFISLNAGKTYKVYLNAISAEPRPIRVVIQRNQDDFKRYFINGLEIGDVPKNIFVGEFSMEMDEPNAKIGIIYGHSKQDFELRELIILEN